MTFTVVARSAEDGALGICLATGPYGVASRCPHVRGGVAAISSQCHSNPKLGEIGLDLAQNGMTPAQILTALANYDSHFEYRQIGIVTADGETGVHSGVEGKDFTGHKLGDGFVVMGNAIAGNQVIEAMYQAYLDEASQDFEERLMRTLEAGYRAGGQPIGQCSAGLIVAPPGARPRTDLRVDVAHPSPEEGGDAVLDLRRVFDAFKPLIPYYSDYWPDHPEVYWTEWRDRVG
jgi:uncharacterized Ntn-hydrolase superfamily protein